MNKHEYKGRAMQWKPFIMLKNKKARVKLVREHAQKDSSFWKILFLDEYKLNLDGSDGKVFVLRKPGEEFHSKSWRWLGLFFLQC